MESWGPLLELCLFMQGDAVPSEYTSPWDMEHVERVVQRGRAPNLGIPPPGSLREVCDAGLKEQEGFLSVVISKRPWKEWEKCPEL